MSIDIAELVVKLEADNRKLNDALDKSNRKLNVFETRAKKNLKEVNESFRRYLGGAAIAATVAGFGKGVMQASLSLEQLKIQLETATGSVEGAEKAFDSLEEFATRTPYQIEQLIEAFVKLKNFGLDPSEEALTSFGNTASATSKDFIQMIEAVADGATQEMERLKEFGITASKQGDQIAFTFDKVTTVVKRDSESIQGYLLDIGNVKFAGSMDRLAKSLGGAFSNLEGAYRNLFRVEGEELSNFKEDIIELTDVLNDPRTIQGVQKLAQLMINMASIAVQSSAWLANTTTSVLGSVDRLLRGTNDLEGQIESIQKTIRNSAFNSVPLDLNQMFVDFDRLKKMAPAATLEEIEQGLESISWLTKRLDSPLLKGLDGELAIMQDINKVLLDARDAREAFNAANAATNNQGKGSDSRALKEASKVSDDYRKKMEKLAIRINEAVDPQAKFNAQVAELKDAMDIGRLSLQSHDKQLEIYKEQLEDATKKTSEAAEAMQESFSDFFFDPFQDGIRGLVNSFNDAIRRIVADKMAAKLTEKLSPSLDKALRFIGLDFDGGGYTGSAPRSGGLDGKGGFMAMLHPQETVIDHTKGQSVSQGPVTVSFNVTANDTRGFDDLLTQRRGLIVNMMNDAINNTGRSGLV